MVLRIAVPLSLILLLVSCATPATNSRPDQTARPPDQIETPDQTAEAGQTVTPETDGGDDGDAGAHHDVPELEALLPEELDGLQLTANSFQGRDSIEAGGFDVEEAATSLERDLGDVSIVTWTSENEELEVLAIRVQGRSGEDVLQAYRPDLEGFEEDFQGNVMSRAVSGGPAESGEPGIYIFTTPDLYVEVVTTDRYYVDVVLLELR